MKGIKKILAHHRVSLNKTIVTYMMTVKVQLQKLTL